MRTRNLTVVVLGMLLSLVAPAQDSPARNAPKSAVSGKVAATGSRRPLRGVMVSLATEGERGVGWRLFETVLTGEAGLFEFEELPPGNYGIRCYKSGYGPRSEIIQEVTLRAGERVEDIEIEMPAPGVISGAVLDPEGNPVPDVRVIAEIPFSAIGPARLGEAGFAISDDQGRYRIWGLSPGRYTVRAKETYWGPSPAFAQTYYPSSMDRNTAARVRVDWDAEAGGIDIRLQPTPPTLVRGVVRDGTTGAAVPGQDIRFIREDGRFSAEAHSANSAKDGTYYVEGLPPGTYRIVTTHNEPRLYGYGEVQLVSGRVVEADLRLLPGTEVSGTVRAIQADDRAEAVPTSSSSLWLEGEHHWNGNDSMTPLDASGRRFELKNVAPGTYRMQSNCAVVNGYVVGVAAAGVPLPSIELTVRPGSPLRDLEVRCGYELGEVRGVVKPSDEAEPFARLPYLRIWAAPADDSIVNQVGYWMIRSSSRFEGVWLYPGRYRIYAVSSWLNLDWDDAEIARALAPFGRTVDVKPGEPLDVELVYVPSEFRLP